MIKILSFFFIFFYMQAGFSQEPSYESVRLKKMPFDVQNTVKNTFLKFKLHPTLIGPEGSRLLGLNMLFTDDFFVQKIALKYDVKGDFKMDEVYRFGKYQVLHFKMAGVVNSIMFQKIKVHEIQKIISELEQIKTVKNTHDFSIVPKAYAAECFAPDSYSMVSIDTQVSENSVSAMITKCFGSMGDGVEESTVGMVKGMWNSLSNEASRFMDNPSKRLNEYYDYAATGVEALWDFSKTVAKMMVDPVYASKVLVEKFGEIGQFFVKAYNGIKAMPMAQKVDVICNIIGSLGVDFLLAAVTVGAASGKLGLTAARILNKLLSISRMVGKGLMYPFKVLEKFGEKTLKSLERIVESGNQKIFDKKLKRLGCAL